jgi:hypothetical protein
MGDEFEDDQDSTNTLSTTYNPDGSVFYQEPGGGSYTYRPDGTIVTGSGANEAVYNPSTGLATYVDPKYFDPATGKYDWAKFAIGAGGVAGALNASKGLQGGAGAGYQGGIPTLYGGRTMMTAPPKMVDGKPRRPGQAGVDYGGDVTYFNTKKEVDQGIIDNARRSGVGLPDAWGTYNAQQKIDWFNKNTISADQMLAAGVKQSDIDWMLQNGYMGFPSGWNSFTGEQKAKWFNDKKITPDQLSKYGVTPEELAWMRSHGYTIGATASDQTSNNNQTVDDGSGQAIGSLKTPKGWNSLGEAGKIKWYNDNGITPAQLKAAGVKQSDIDYMYTKGYTIDKPNAGRKIGNATIPAGWDSLNSADKIKWYNDNRITPAQLLAEGVPQSAIDFMYANGYTIGKTAADTSNNTNVANSTRGSKIGLTTVPGNWDTYSPKQKIDWFNIHQITPSDLLAAGQKQSDIDWMYQNGYKIGTPTAPVDGSGVQVGAVKTPVGWNSLNEAQKIKWYNDNNITVDNLLKGGAKQSDIDYMKTKGYNVGANNDTSRGLLSLPSNLSSMTAADKAKFYKESINKGYSDAEIRQAAGTQTDADWKGLQDLASKLTFAKGGKARYLRGETDGMADQIPSSIGGREPAALSHGEFVIPADVVSHLGNGNSDAGAKKLYQMMDKLRMARTGTKKQGKKINPDKFMPGGLAQAYAEGGAVKHFTTGGTTGVAPAVNAGVTGIESNLSNWAGPYVTNMLGKGKALSEMPYQAYTGPLTAGQSDLQEKVSTGLQGLNFPGNLGQSFASSAPTGAPTMPADMSTYAPQQKADLYNKFRSQGYGDQAIRQAAGTQTDSDWQYLQDLAAKSGPMNIPQQQGLAGSYMNPYLQNVLQPQLAELSRQSQINLQPSLAKLTSAGGYGGGRQAIMESEAGRNLLNAQNTAIGTGYANAYDKAMQQFNTEQGQAKTLADMMAGQGATDRGITAEGIAADKAQFEEARENPYKMVQYQQSLLQGMPLSAQAYNTTGESALVAASKGAKTVADFLKNLGITLPG